MSNRVINLLLLGAAVLWPGIATARATSLDDWVGHWSGKLTQKENDYPIHIDISKSPDGYMVTFDLPEYSLYGCAAAASLRDDEIVIRPSLIKGELRGTLSDGVVRGEADLISGHSKLELRRKSRRPRTYVEEMVRFESGDARLVGALVKPRGRGPFPVIIWTHGSGPDTRKTLHYRGRAHLMAQHGVASLIYDKRGAGESTGGEYWKIEKLVQDAIAAVNAVKDRPDIDAEHIGMAGFSQGGWVAPMAAARNSDINFVLVGAAPGITAGEQNVFSLGTRLERGGFDQPAIEAAAGLLTQLYEFYQTGDDREELAAAMKAAETTSWFKHAVFQRLLFLPDGGLPQGRNPHWQPFSPDPLESWRRIRVPVLSVWGELDGNLPAALSKERIDRALGTAGNTDRKLIIFPNADHGLWIVRDKDASWDWPRQAPGYHATIVEWIVQHIRR